MEKYNHQNTFQIVDAKEQGPLTPEIEEKIAEIRKETITAIQRQETFFYVRNKAIGDNFILRASYQKLCTKLCEQEGVDPNLISIRSNRTYDGPGNFLKT